MSLTGKVLDWQDDLDSSHFVKVAGKLPTNVSPPSVTSALPDEYFGLIYIDKNGFIERRFPLVSPGDLVMAARYLFTNPDTKNLPLKARAILAKNIVCQMDRQALSESILSETPEYKMCKDFLSGEAAQVAEQLKGRFLNTFDEKSVEKYEALENGLDRQLSRDGGIARAGCGSDSTDPRSPNNAMGQGDCGGTEFAIIVKVAGGAHEGLWPINNKEQIKTAVEYFKEHKDKMPGMTRREFATNVIKQAHKLNCTEDIPENHPLTVEAGVELRDDWKAAFLIRSNWFRSQGDNDSAESMFDAMDKVASGKMSPLSAETLLWEIDAATGMNRMYGLRMTEPHLDLFKKFAMDRVIDRVGSRDIKFSEIQNFGKDFQKVSSVLDDRSAREFCEQPVPYFLSLPAAFKSAIIQKM